MAMPRQNESLPKFSLTRSRVNDLTMSPQPEEVQRGPVLSVRGSSRMGKEKPRTYRTSPRYPCFALLQRPLP